MLLPQFQEDQCYPLGLIIKHCWVNDHKEKTYKDLIKKTGAYWTSSHQTDQVTEFTHGEQTAYLFIFSRESAIFPSVF